MKKKKFSELTKVSSLASDERVVSLSADMKTLMAATKAATGDNLSMSSAAGFTGDNAHELQDRGITWINMTDAINQYGLPTSTGILVNLQRNVKNSVTASQYIFQVFFSPVGIYYRYGNGNGTTIVYQPWKTFVLS